MTTCVLIVALLGYLNAVCAVDKYALGYNYFDEMAKKYCAAKGTGCTFSLRRECGGVAPTYDEICTSATTEILTTIRNQQTKVACFDAFNINKHHNTLLANPSPSQPDAGKVSFATFGYGSSGCTWRANHCGPNYCCCRAFS